MNIYKIAEKTGFSSATVARALSGSGYCKQATKDKITSAAEELGYVANSSARALRSNRTEKILFCIPDICNPFYFKMIQGANTVLENNNYYAMLCDTKHSIRKEIMFADLLQKKYCDGVILVSFHFCEENIAAIRRTKRPFVLTNRYPLQTEQDNFDYVYVDHVAGMDMLTEHMIECGCRRIVLILGNLSEQTSREREQGYRAALARNGIEYDGSLVLNGAFETEATYAALKEYFERGGTADGIVCGNDLAALGALRVCRERGLSIPAQIKVASFDNTDYATICQPPLTSIDMMQYEIGENAAVLLMERINGRTAVKNCLIQPKLIVRESTRG